MRTLWEVITFPTFHGSRFQGSLNDYKEFLQRTIDAQGAKYTRYVQLFFGSLQRLSNKAGCLTLDFSTCRYVIHILDGCWNRETSQGITQFFEGLIQERQYEGHSMLPKLTDLTASIWLKSGNDIVCNVHQGFQWGCVDVDGMLRQIKHSYAHLIDFSTRIRLAVHLPHLLGSTLPEQVNETTLVDSNRTSEEILYPAGIDVIFHCEGHPDNEPRWSQLLSGTTKALCTSNLTQNIPPGCASGPKLVLEAISKRGAMSFLGMVSHMTNRHPLESVQVAKAHNVHMQLSDAIRSRSNYLCLGVEIVVSQDLTRQDFRELADTLVDQYIQRRRLLLPCKPEWIQFALLDVTEERCVEVTLVREESILEVCWSEEDLVLTYPV
jgi:hypothetical protein